MNKLFFVLAFFVLLFNLNLNFVFSQEQNPIFTNPNFPEIDFSNIDAKKIIEVSVSNVVLDNETAIYKPGDKITGKVYLITGYDQNIVGLTLIASLVSGYNDFNFQNAFASQKIKENIVVSPDKIQEIPFEYTVPNSGTVGSNALFFELTSQNGEKFGFSFKEVVLEKLLENIESYYNFNVNDLSFMMQQGPTVKSEDNVFIKSLLLSKQNISVKPYIEIYEFEPVNEPVKKYELPQISLIANEENTSELKINFEDLKPGVYAGKLTFLDENNTTRSEDINFRFIVDGPISTIKTITADKSFGQKGDVVNLNVGIVGKPYDITSGSIEENKQNILLEVSFVNEKREIVGQNSVFLENISESYLEHLISVELTQDTNNIIAKLILKDQNQNTLAETSLFLGEEFEFVDDEKTNNYIIILVYTLIILIAFISIFYIFKNNKSNILKMFVVLFFVFFFNSNFAEANGFYYWGGQEWGGGNNFSMSYNMSGRKAGDIYNPGDQFTLSVSGVYSTGCNNQTVTSWVRLYDIYNSNSIVAQGSNSIQANHCNVWWSGYWSSNPSTSYTYTAPTTPGTYTVWFSGYSQNTHSYCSEGSLISPWSPWSGSNWYNYYYQFTVAEVPAPTLNVSCSASPSSVTTDQNVTWTTNPTGGTGTYTYSWSGTENLSGSTQNITKSYTETGTKIGSVTVTSGTQSKTISCDNVVTVLSKIPDPIPDQTPISMDCPSQNQCTSNMICVNDLNLCHIDNYEYELGESSVSARLNPGIVNSGQYCGVFWKISSNNPLFCKVVNSQNNQVVLDQDSNTNGFQLVPGRYLIKCYDNQQYTGDSVINSNQVTCLRSPSIFEI
jgi:hypothetical protein